MTARIPEMEIRTQEVTVMEFSVKWLRMCELPFSTANQVPTQTYSPRQFLRRFLYVPKALRSMTHTCFRRQPQTCARKYHSFILDELAPVMGVHLNCVDQGGHLVLDGLLTSASYIFQHDTVYAVTVGVVQMGKK